MRSIHSYAYQHITVMKNFLLNRAASLSLVAVFFLVAGCGGPPGNNPLVDASRTAYDAAARNADVVSNAPEILKTAQSNLVHSEKLLSDGADVEEVEHFAYLAKQNVAIAHETTRLKLAEEAISQAQTERTAVQLQARTAEAERKTAEAVTSANEAERARDQAQRARELTEQANERAADLASRIAELEAEQTARGLVLTLGDVLFDVGKSDLKPGATRAMDELTNFLNEYTDRNVLIEGFTDDTGSEQLNLDLSSRRSAAVKSALVARGISTSRIQTMGYGEAFPKVSNATSAGRQQNRRVELVISDESGKIPSRTN
ncbi:MAG: OmpA family protein [Candidatus Paceibacterota bacterium]